MEEPLAGGGTHGRVEESGELSEKDLAEVVGGVAAPWFAEDADALRDE